MSAEGRRFARRRRRRGRDGLRLKRRAGLPARRAAAQWGPVARAPEVDPRCCNGQAASPPPQFIGLPPDVYQRRRDRLNRRLAVRADATCRDADAHRLAERLRRCREFVFTFLDYAEVTADNPFAERQIRPAVILRKNRPSNRSAHGAATQAVLMSVYRTLKLRGLHPTQTVVPALRTYLRTGQLPRVRDSSGGSLVVGWGSRWL